MGLPIVILSKMPLGFWQWLISSALLSSSVFPLLIIGRGTIMGEPYGLMQRPSVYLLSGFEFIASAYTSQTSSREANTEL